MRKQRFLWALPVPILLLACGEGGGESPYDKKLDIEPAVCAGTWQSIQVLPQHGAIRVHNMGWLSDRLYYRHFNIKPPFDGVLVTIAADGTIASAPDPYHYHFTTDGLKFAFITDKPPASKYELWTKPLDASDWTLETSFAFAGVIQSELAQPFVVTADSIYGGVRTEDAFLVSRFDRVTGAEQRLAAIRFPAFEPDKFTTWFFGDLFLWNDWLFFYSDSVSFSLPKAGGEPLYMPDAYGNPFGPLAASSSGQVLMQGFDSPNTSFLAVAQVGTSGPPARFRTDLPKQLVTTAAFDDGKGGWVLAGIERLADGAEHITVYSLDSAGKSRRLACDPETGRSASQGALAPHGLYLSPLQLSPVHNEIVFVPLL